MKIYIVTTTQDFKRCKLSVSIDNKDMESCPPDKIVQEKHSETEIRYFISKGKAWNYYHKQKHEM